MKPRYVYALIDPRYDEVRYVGTSTEPWARVYLPYVENRPWQSHVAQALAGGKSHKDFWIQGLAADGMLPTMAILEWGVWSIESCAEREIWWIAFHRRLGAKLTNQSDGGEQTPLWKMSDDTKALIARRTREAMQRPDVRAKYEAAMLKHRAANPARPTPTADELEARRMNGRLKNRDHSRSVWASYTPEQRAERGRKISEAKLRNRKSDEQRKDDGVRMVIGRRLAKARRNGWTLPIIAL